MIAVIVSALWALVTVCVWVWSERRHEIRREMERERLLMMIETLTAFIAEMGATQAGIATRPAVREQRSPDAETRLRREIEEGSRETTQQTIERGAQAIKKAYIERGMTISDDDAREQARRMVTGKGLEQ